MVVFVKMWVLGSGVKGLCFKECGYVLMWLCFVVVIILCGFV